MYHNLLIHPLPWTFYAAFRLLLLLNTQVQRCFKSYTFKVNSITHYFISLNLFLIPLLSHQYTLLLIFKIPLNLFSKNLLIFLHASDTPLVKLPTTLAYTTAVASYLFLRIHSNPSI